MHKSRLALAAVLALAALFAATVIYSVLRRTETTYNYPAYSSLNNSDQGTKAYFDVLARLGVATSRNFRLLPKLLGVRAAIFYGGPELWAFQFSDQKDLELFEQLATRGARVILALDPEGVIETHPASPKKQSRKTEKPPENNLEKRWGIRLAHADRTVTAETRAFLSTLQMSPVNWQFSSWPHAWTPSHMRNGAPLFLERTFGNGSIVLIPDSKLFTNRELLVHPDTDVLASAPGAYRDIIFDENHLGLQDTGTVLGLATAHGLHWMLLGFFILAILYVWRSSSSFIPLSPLPVDSAIGGRDAHVALSNLLMQSVPAKSVLRFAAEEWNRSAALQSAAARRIIDNPARLEALSSDTVAAGYREIAVHLHPRARTIK